MKIASTVLRGATRSNAGSLLGSNVALYLITGRDTRKQATQNFYDMILKLTGNNPEKDLNMFNEKLDEFSPAPEVTPAEISPTQMRPQ